MTKNALCLMAWGVFAGTEWGRGEKSGGHPYVGAPSGDHAGSPLFCFIHLLNL